MKQENEQTCNGIWTQHEHYVFCAILSHLRTLGRPLQVKEIVHLYAKTRETVIQDSIEITLKAKTELQINAKLIHYLKEECISKQCGTINYLP